MNPVRYMILGRFAPIHNGHSLLTQSVQKKYGEAKCGILIGSSNIRINSRTPFSFEKRMEWIQTLFPHTKIFHISDVEEDLPIQRHETLGIWQQQLKAMEEASGEKWIFCGGSIEDLKDLTPLFMTEIIVHREIEGQKISGTALRKLLSKKKYSEAKKYLPSIAEDICREYSKISDFF